MISADKLTSVSIDTAMRSLHAMHRKQRVVPDQERPIAVNIGCGLQAAPGWLNIDGSLNAWFANQPSWLLERLDNRQEYSLFVEVQKPGPKLGGRL